jgi:hypothetical protein
MIAKIGVVITRPDRPAVLVYVKGRRRRNPAVRALAPSLRPSSRSWLSVFGPRLIAVLIFAVTDPIYAIILGGIRSREYAARSAGIAQPCLPGDDPPSFRSVLVGRALRQAVAHS